MILFALLALAIPLLLWAATLSATSCIVVDARPGTRDRIPCGIIQPGRAYFFGVVTEIRYTGKNWSDPSTAPMYKVRYRVEEALLGVDAGEMVTVFEPEKHSVGARVFVEAHREWNGEWRYPICGRTLVAGLAGFLRARLQMKPTEGTSLTVHARLRNRESTPVRMRVRIDGPVRRAGRTNAKGEVRFGDLPPGRYSVEADRQTAGTVESREVTVLAQSCGVAFLWLENGSR
ncbi:MAG: carboxypeptidase regulatory-like domain-containing protein [Bryobacterales bacterium]|nr:carboxypeptidase regulatory-like domain-containing protein [Bryobacterales bacterium]